MEYVRDSYNGNTLSFQANERRIIMSLITKFKETFFNLFSKPHAGVITTPVEDDDLTVVSPSMAYAKPEEVTAEVPATAKPVQAAAKSTQKPAQKPRKPRTPKQ